MSKRPKVVNITNGHRVKLTQATMAVQNCAAAWVEFGVSIRNLTVAEAIAARNIQARRNLSASLPAAELLECIYEPAPENEASHKEEIRLMREANRLAPYREITQSPRTVQGGLCSPK
jgi:hypothetical protein